MTAAADKQTKNSRPPRTLRHTARHQLVLVSEDVMTEQAIRIALKDHFNVVRLNHSQKTVSQSILGHVDLIMLDWPLLDRSDFQSLGTIRKLNPEAEIIIISSNPSTDIILQAVRLGANDFIVKPIDLQSLRKSTAMALKRRRQSLARQECEKQYRDRRIHEERSEATLQMCFGILHDLKTALAYISLTSGFINSKMGGCSSLEGLSLEETKDEIADLGRYANYCVDIANRMDPLCPSEADPTLNPTRVDRIVRDAIFLAKRLPVGHKHQIVNDGYPLTASIRIRESDLFQLVINLIVNGLQSSDRPHEVTVEATQVDEPLELHREDRSHQWALYSPQFVNEPPLVGIFVRDDGDGMSSEHLRRAFDFRFTTKPRSQGTGLGLAIVRDLVNEGQGAIQVSSKLGQGTRISVFFHTAKAGSANQTTHG